MLVTKKNKFLFFPLFFFLSSLVMGEENGYIIPDFPKGFPPNMVSAATVGGGIFGGISSINSFRQVSELKEINGKLDTVISLQYQTLKELRAMGIQFRIDLTEESMINVQRALEARHLSFKQLTGVFEVKNGIVAVRASQPGEPNYKKRLEDLMWGVQDYSNELSLFGPGGHMALYSSISLLDTIFKVGQVDNTVRLSFLRTRKKDIEKFLEEFNRRADVLEKRNKNIINSMNIPTAVKVYSHGYLKPSNSSGSPHTTYFCIKGNLNNWYHFAAFEHSNHGRPWEQGDKVMCSGKKKQDWRPLTHAGYLPSAKRVQELFALRTEYNANKPKLDDLREGTIANTKEVLRLVNILIGTYSS